MFAQLLRILALVLLLGVPVVMVTAPPPVDFVDLLLHRDAYRAALGWPQLQPSPCRISIVPAGSAPEVGVVRQVRRLPRVYALNWPLGNGREVQVEARLPRGYYQMSGSTLARLRLVLSFLLFYLLLLLMTTRLVRRLGTRLQKLRSLAHRLAEGDLQASLDSEPEDSAEYDHLRRTLLQMAQTLGQRQQEEQEQRRQFEQAALERNRRLAEVSHDLRTPLTSILGYAQLHGGLELVEREGQALLDRVGQWLEACRLDSASLDVRLVAADLHDLLEEGFHLAQQQVEVDLPLKSPLVQADLFLFPRVLAHLLRNLNCREVKLKLSFPRLEVSGHHPREQQRDPWLLSLDGCRHLLEAHGVWLESSEERFVLIWEVP